MRKNQGLWLAIAVVATSACRGQAKAPVVHRDFQAEAKALVEGLGAMRTCRTDRDCTPIEPVTNGLLAPKIQDPAQNPRDPSVAPPVEAACVLGACFGILSADNRTARQTVVTRLRYADQGVRDAAWPMLKKVLEGAESSPLELAAVDGAGALLEAKPDTAGQCGEICLAIRREMATPDEHVAAAARLALGRAGDPTVTAALVADLMHGTELQRTEAVRALAPAVRRHDAEALAAVVDRLQDRSPVVAEAAVRTLAPVAGQPTVRAGLAKLRERTPHLAYAIDAVAVP